MGPVGPAADRYTCKHWCECGMGVGKPNESNPKGRVEVRTRRYERTFGLGYGQIQMTQI